MGESSSKELQEEEMEKLQKAIDHNQNMTFSNICSSVRDAIAAIDVALDDFAEWICKRLNLDEVPAYTEYEYMMLERIQKELEVVNSSLTRFNTDVKQFLVKEGWGEAYYGDREETRKMNEIVEELKEKYIKNPKRIRKNSPDYV